MAVPLLSQLELNFTLNIHDKVEGNQVNHFGFQVETREEIAAHHLQLKKEGFFAREEMDTICCYAVQGKFLVTDPDGNEWELFYTKSDSEVQQIGASLEVENNKTSSFNCFCF
ncbi:hypothetical protein A3863_14185 [Priestia endophytica]|nr:hypothetical protein A3863_14185 [Priestia endophytica]